MELERIDENYKRFGSGKDTVTHEIGEEKRMILRAKRRKRHRES